MLVMFEITWISVNPLFPIIFQPCSWNSCRMSMLFETPTTNFFMIIHTNCLSVTLNSLFNFRRCRKTFGSTLLFLLWLFYWITFFVMLYLTFYSLFKLFIMPLLRCCRWVTMMHIFIEYIWWLVMLLFTMNWWVIFRWNTNTG